MINFKLNDFDKIRPVGQESNLFLSWYWLTDGEIWLSFGDNKLYEYSNEAISYFGKENKYNSYFLVRFLEDFMWLFKRIGEPVPDNLYDLTSNITSFLDNTQKWLNIYESDDEDEEYSDFYFEEYSKLTSWLFDRSFTSIELIGGPTIFFIRSKDRIRIIWLSDETLENGIRLWTAANGSFEMDYSEFTNEVKNFGDTFFKQMERQVELAIAKEWGDVKIDKTNLLKEQKLYQQEFDENYKNLTQNDIQSTNWQEICLLYDRMLSEIK